MEITFYKIQDLAFSNQNANIMQLFNFPHAIK